MTNDNDPADALDAPSGGCLTRLAPPQEPAVLPKRRAWACLFDSTCADSYGPALEVATIKHSPKKETA